MEDLDFLGTLGAELRADVLLEAAIIWEEGRKSKLHSSDWGYVAIYLFWKKLMVLKNAATQLLQLAQAPLSSLASLWRQRFLCFLYAS